MSDDFIEVLLVNLKEPYKEDIIFSIFIYLFFYFSKKMLRVVY